MATHGRNTYNTALWVWPFEDAIGHLRDLLPAGRRGRWVIMVPPHADGGDLKWIRGMGPLVSRHPLSDGDVAYLVAEPL